MTGTARKGDSKSGDSGILLHAKHAFMPNKLGFCGPDDRGEILRHLEEGRGGERLLSTLREFEAAYPFLKLIARATGRDVFDYSVPEAYWIGNALLDQVSTLEFYNFSHRELKGRDSQRVTRIFKALGLAARPHHSFYVITTYAGRTLKDGPSFATDNARRVLELIDNCRIAWGEVRRVDASSLQVDYRPLVVEDGRLALSKPELKKVGYTPEVKPFDKIKAGDHVSLHWNYACDVLSPRQLKSITRYTMRDIASTNMLVEEESARR